MSAVTIEMLHLLRKRIKKQMEDPAPMNMHPIDKIIRDRRLDLAREWSGFDRLPEECDHLRKTFNGYVWRCSDCGSKIR
jgi:hypothetical protein